MDKSEVDDLRTLVQETKAARAALEAKGAFTDANAATHVVLALEALCRACHFETLIQLQDSFNRGLASGH